MNNGLVSDFAGVSAPKPLHPSKARRKHYTTTVIPPGKGLARDEETGDLKLVRTGTGKGISRQAFRKPQSGDAGIGRGDLIFTEEPQIERLRPTNIDEAEIAALQAERAAEMLLQLRGESTPRHVVREERRKRRRAARDAAKIAAQVKP